MSERFVNRLNDKNIKFMYQNPVWDTEKEDAYNVFEMIHLMNNIYNSLDKLYKKNSNLRKENYGLLNEIDSLEEKLKLKENSIFVGVDANHYERWINQIKEYVDLEDDDFIIKLALSYTLQSLRCGENLRRFQWGNSGECL